jgi:transcription antitermination factor NusG
MYSQLCDGRWIAVQVKAGTERKIADSLILREYELFLPIYRKRGRITTQERVLFPGYVFCRYLEQARHRIVEIPGVVRLVGLSKTPIPIPDDEIEAIRRIVDSGFHSEPWKFLTLGQHVRVLRGPLEGLTGLLVAHRKSNRLVVAVSLLSRSVAAEVDAADTEPIESQMYDEDAVPQHHSGWQVM